MNSILGRVPKNASKRRHSLKAKNVNRVRNNHHQEISHASDNREGDEERPKRRAFQYLTAKDAKKAKSIPSEEHPTRRSHKNQPRRSRRRRRRLRNLLCKGG